MENNQFLAKQIFKNIEGENLLCRVCGNPKGKSKRQSSKLLLDLQIQNKNPNSKNASQRVLVSIKPRTPAIRTLYIAEKSRFHSKKASSGSRLAIGDHSSFTTHYSDRFSKTNNCNLNHKSKRESNTEKDDSSTQIDSSSSDVQCFENQVTSRSSTADEESGASEKKCFLTISPKSNFNVSKFSHRNKNLKTPITVNLATIGEKDTRKNVLQSDFVTLHSLHKRIESLEQEVNKILLFRSMESKINISSSDEEKSRKNHRKNSPTSRAGCSYIQQYSRIPDTSAFQRYANQPAPLSPSKATTIEKEHNSEQYGRDFTTYDGITARGRRQCASVPCKRDEGPKMAAERVHKIRHKLNPVRDYRLMDTVHYLAQGEFAPREDGIKLTPSREAVLSDIIWEDVCRTHWPSTRLGRRQPERCSTRYELQKLIDSLLRERVAHVERRRRRHYRIVKLNHRHENCRPVGKTGDIIVASHKNKDDTNEREKAGSDHNATWKDESQFRSHRSHDRIFSETRHRQRSHTTDSSPGPSKINRCINSREPTICYQTSSPLKVESYRGYVPKTRRRELTKYITSGSSVSNTKRPKQPRLVVKKNSSARKRKMSDEPDLEHFILLPTLVVRTPSNVRRQKKFNDLYHRILNTKLNNSGQDSSSVAVEPDNKTKTNPVKRDIGLNINITLSESEERLHKKR